MEGRKLLQQLLRSGISASYCLLNALTYVIKVSFSFKQTQATDLRAVQCSCAGMRMGAPQAVHGQLASVHASFWKPLTALASRASLPPA